MKEAMGKVSFTMEEERNEKMNYKVSKGVGP